MDQNKDEKVTTKEYEAFQAFKTKHNDWGKAPLGTEISGSTIDPLTQLPDKLGEG